MVELTSFNAITVGAPAANAAKSTACRRKFAASPAAANVDEHVATVHPAQLLQPLPKRRNVGLCSRVSLRDQHQCADTPQPLSWLRACRERTRSRTAKQRDELAPLHRLVTPVLPNERNSTPGVHRAADFGRLRHQG